MSERYYKTCVYAKDGKIMPWMPERTLYFGRYYCEALKTLNEIRKVSLKDAGAGFVKTHKYDCVRIEVVE